MNATTRRIAEAVSEHIVELSQTRLAEMVASYKTLRRANEELRHLTGIHRFFDSQQAFDEFRRLIKLPAQKPASPKSREWGDFQTPPGLARQVCRYLVETGASPTVVVEPTYGLGNFILATLEMFPTVKLVYGVELQEKYEWHLKIALLIKALLGRPVTAEIELHQDNVFAHQFPDHILKAQNLLVIGNPPWVTNAELGALESRNLPQKQNLKSLNGLDALTGKSNFDISEYILLRLLDWFSHRPGILAMLCKNSMAKNIIEILPKRQFRVSNIRTLEINATREFGAAVDACLLVMELGVPRPEQVCQVAPLENPRSVARVFGWVGDKFVSNVQDYLANSEFDGKSALVWRQGLKHDCARIMELDASAETLTNGNGETAEVEEEHLYWLLKSSALRHFEPDPPRKKVIVTQNRLGEDTSVLRVKAPKLWKYLVKNSQYFEKRKSSIYRDRPRFSIFGVGEYSFKNYKVAISGLYKEPNFSLVCPIDNRPVMLDDTCYFVGFDAYREALFTASLFNSPPVKRFLRSIVFTDAKRPYTKEALMRVNVTHALSHLSLEMLQDFWISIGYEPREHITQLDWENYKESFVSTDAKPEVIQLSLSA